MALPATLPTPGIPKSPAISPFRCAGGFRLGSHVGLPAAAATRTALRAGREARVGALRAEERRAAAIFSFGVRNDSNDTAAGQLCGPSSVRIDLAQISTAM
eukprot:GHRQ01028208.1.p3 GENE.GHRQ01028208.1~~GHRQ01028208.1.p3  ORF type:complete len:101 (+),score=7.63 GHRQ01028208.1:323-625(+)